jgi:RNA polymerase sigma-70 factor (ECF subfamily)
MTDGDLVRQALAGQTAAREELARVWSPRVLAMCRARIGRNAAEDVAQESLARAFHELRQIADPDRFGGWLRSIAARVCIDWHRRNRLPGRSAGTAPPEVLENLAARSSDGEPDRAEQQHSLWQAIDELPEELREVLLLFYCDQLSYDAIADWLEVSRSTVNCRLAKARDCLRRRMTKTMLEPDRGVCSGT